MPEEKLTILYQLSEKLYRLAGDLQRKSERETRFGSRVRAAFGAGRPSLKEISDYMFDIFLDYSLQHEPPTRNSAEVVAMVNALLDYVKDAEPAGFLGQIFNRFNRVLYHPIELSQNEKGLLENMVKSMSHSVLSPGALTIYRAAGIAKRLQKLEGFINIYKGAYIEKHQTGMANALKKTGLKLEDILKYFNDLRAAQTEFYINSVNCSLDTVNQLRALLTYAEYLVQPELKYIAILVPGEREKIVGIVEAAERRLEPPPAMPQTARGEAEPAASSTKTPELRSSPSDISRTSPVASVFRNRLISTLALGLGTIGCVIGAGVLIAVTGGIAAAPLIPLIVLAGSAGVGLLATIGTAISTARVRANSKDLLNGMSHQHPINPNDKVQPLNQSTVTPLAPSVTVDIPPVELLTTPPREPSDDMALPR